MANTRGVFTLQEVRYAIEDEAWVGVADVYTQEPPVPITVYETAYFGGGYVPAITDRLSTVERLSYSNDTFAEVPGAALSGIRDSLSATGDQSVGYFFGGNA